MIEHRDETGIDEVEFEVDSTSVDQRSLSDEQWMVYNCLRDRSRPIRLSSLARELVEKRRKTWKAKALDDAMDVDPAELIEIQLHHVVLPSLEDLGILAYDPGRKTVAPPEGSDRF